MGVGPSQVILSADQQTGTFSVYNAGDLEEIINLTARDFYYDAAGQRVTSDVLMAQGAASWLQIEPPTFVFQPEQSQTVTFTVVIPKTRRRVTMSQISGSCRLHPGGMGPLLP